MSRDNRAGVGSLRWITGTWYQNGCPHVMSPVAADVEATAAAWLVDLLGLPSRTSVGFPAGTTTTHERKRA